MVREIMTLIMITEASNSGGISINKDTEKRRQSTERTEDDRGRRV